MIKNFKQTMIKDVEMMNFVLMTYYSRIKIKQGEDGIFVNQQMFTKEILKNLKIKDCAKVNTLVECGEKMSRNNEVEKINSIIFKA